MTVYFIQSENSNVKIGYSGFVERRVTELLKQHGGVFLGHLPGDRKLERHFHEMFRRQRLAGEWFEPSDEMLSLIAAVADPIMPMNASRRPAEVLRDLDLMYAREAADALAEIIFQMRDNEPMEAVCRLLAPALGMSEARLLAIRDCEVDSVTVAEFSKITAGPELARRVRDAEIMEPGSTDDLDV